MSGDHSRSLFSLDGGNRAGTLDLQLTIVLTVLSATVLLVPMDEPTLLRAIVGLPLLIFLPGYAIAAALFPASVDERVRSVSALRNPERRAVTAVERVVISFVASVAVVGIAAIVADAVVGVRMVPTLGIVVAVTLVATIVGYAQRVQLPTSRRFTPGQSLSGPLFPTTATGWFLAVATVVALLVVAASGVAAVSSPGDGVTEFYVGGETENGTIAMGEQPTDLTVGETVTHYVVVEQRQATAENYTVVAELVDGTGETATELGRYPLTVNATGTAVQPIQVTASDATENASVRYYLYADEPTDEPTREGASQYLSVDLTVSDS